MARLNGNPPFLGTRDGICIYTRWGNHYVRTRSTLSGKRVRSAPEFKKTRENASFLSSASRLASGIYRGLEIKNVQLYRHMTGEALKLLKSGMKEEQVVQELQKQFFDRPESEPQESREPLPDSGKQVKRLNSDAKITGSSSLNNLIIRPYSPESKPDRRQGSPPARNANPGGYP